MILPGASGIIGVLAAVPPITTNDPICIFLLASCFLHSLTGSLFTAKLSL